MTNAYYGHYCEGCVCADCEHKENCFHCDCDICEKGDMLCFGCNKFQEAAKDEE